MCHPDAPAHTPLPQAVILYGRAAFFKRQSFKELRASLQAAFAGVALREAYEDQASPSLPVVLDELQALGLRQVTVLPCGLPVDLSLAHWLPGALRAHLDQRPGLEVTISRPLEDFVDYGRAAQGALAAPSATEVAAARPSMGKPGWTEVPDHRHQIFFCLGARCAHRGAHQLLQALRRELRNARDLNVGEARVLIARSSCLFPCNQGPVMAVHPEGVWYGRLSEERLARIVRQHLLAGEPVEEAVIHRAAAPQQGV